MSLYQDIKLNPPKAGNHSKAKMRAYRAHWQAVARVRDELSSHYIHNGLKLSKLSEVAQISYPTTKRFFEFGKGHGKLTYSYFHGPSATTVFGIAGALGLEVSFKKRNGARNGK